MSWQSVSVTIYYHSLTDNWPFSLLLEAAHISPQVLYLKALFNVPHSTFSKIHITILFAMVTGATLILIFFSCECFTLVSF